MKSEHRSPHSPLENETDCLCRAQMGSHQAYEAIVLHYRERLYSAAIAIVRNHEDARDLSQEAFVRAYKNIARFDITRPFYPWLHRILRNLCLDYLQKHGSHRTISYEALVEDKHVQFEESRGHLSGTSTDPREKIQAEQTARMLRQALELIKPEFREILVMRHFDELSYQEIADTLEIPIGTVMSRLYHARKALKEKIAAGL